MKVRPLTETFPTLNRVEEKRDGDAFSKEMERQESDRQEKHDDEPVDDEEVNRAIEEFSQDKRTAESGLSASRVGDGPGLSVILKDRKGTVLRQLSGQEFLKLREAAGKAGKRGKILDQKL